MKELENNKPDTEFSVKQKKQVEHQFINSIVPHDGHTLWKINNETLEVEKAKFSMARYTELGEIKRDMIIQDGYTYVAALNKKNALKKYHQGKSGGKELGNLKLTAY